MRETVVINTKTVKGRFIKDFIQYLDKLDKEDLKRVIYVLKLFTMNDYNILWRTLQKEKVVLNVFGMCGECDKEIEGQPERCPYCGVLLDYELIKKLDKKLKKEKTKK